MSEQMITKRCSHCKKIKPLSEFSKDKRSKDNHQCMCKKCHLELDRIWRKTEKGKTCNKHYQNSKKCKATQKRFNESEKGKVYNRRNALNQRIRHPDRMSARSAVTSAVRAGNLPRVTSLRCPCGKPAKQYHHYKGYRPEYWLCVIALCIKCHFLANQSEVCIE